MEILDFNKLIEHYMETSDRFELVVYKDGQCYAEYVEGKLHVHLPKAPESNEQPST